MEDAEAAPERTDGGVEVLAGERPREASESAREASERPREASESAREASGRASEASEASERASEAFEGRSESERPSEAFASERLREDPGPDRREREMRESVKRCHVNLGHPSKERFLHMLKSAGASARAIKIAKELKCDICEAKRPPPSRPVAKSRRAQQLNEQVNLDTFELPIFQSRNLHMLNIYDEGTGLQICTPLWRGKTAERVRKSYRKSWKRWCGCPKRILTDNGAEFDGAMQEGLELDGSYVDRIAAYAPWQAGVTERHGEGL